MMKRLRDIAKTGDIEMFGMRFTWKFDRAPSRRSESRVRSLSRPYRVHLGPGPNWVKPNDHWIDVDIDPDRADLIMDFRKFDGFPLDDESADCVYGSHVFEHMSIWVTDHVFSECHRILRPGGYLRLVLPDVEKSIHEYVAENADFPLFRRRAERARQRYALEYTLFDCLREDFLSRSGQQGLLGENALAHQNAWDYESIRSDLQRAGFGNISRSALRRSDSDLFDFEGAYESEALEEDRSLYVEAKK